MAKPMTYTLNNPIQVGDMEIAAISCLGVSAHLIGTALVFNGEKKAVLVLIRRGSEIRGFDVAGHAVSLLQVEQRFPDALAQFRGGALRGSA